MKQAVAIGAVAGMMIVALAGAVFKPIPQGEAPVATVNTPELTSSPNTPELTGKGYFKPLLYNPKKLWTAGNETMWSNYGFTSITFGSDVNMNADVTYEGKVTFHGQVEFLGPVTYDYQCDSN